MPARFLALCERALASRRVAWALAFATAAVGVRIALDPGWLHDEGLLTYGFARAIGEAPLPFAFFQKCKPVLAAIYAVPAAFGLFPFLVTHAVACALAVPLSAEAARALGARLPNLAALAVAASPFVLRSGGLGLSNADGVLAGALVVLFASRRRWLAAGLAAGAAVWVRYELALLAAPLFAYGLLARERRRLPLGMLVFPTAYLVAGAAYHADPLWFVHYPPGISAPMPGFVSHETVFANHSALTLVRALVSVSPAIVAPVLLARVGGPARPLAAHVATFVGLFAVTHTAVLPLGPAFVLGFSERYAMAMLPALAPLVALAADPARPGQRAWLRSLAACAALAVTGAAMRAEHGDLTLLGAVVALALVLALAAWRPRLAFVPLTALLLAGPWMTARWLDEGGFGDRGDDLRMQVELLERRSAPGATIYTTSQMLRPYVERVGALEGRTIRYVVQADQSYELEVLTSPRRGQRGIVGPVLARAVFDDVVDPAGIARDRLRPGDLFLLREEPRRELTFPAETWSEVLVPIDDLGGRWTLLAPRSPDPLALGAERDGPGSSRPHVPTGSSGPSR